MSRDARQKPAADAWVSAEAPREFAETTSWQRMRWPRTLAMHLLPAACTFVVALGLAPLMTRLHLPPTFGLTMAFAFVLTPLELGLLLFAAHRATGRWSLRALPSVLAYRQPIRKWWFLVPPLFIIALVLAIAWTPVGDAIGTGLKHIYPYWTLPSYDGTLGFPRTVSITVLLVTLLIDGITNPIVEELYFRGYLLPRLPVSGWRMVPLGAALFAVQHYWQPYNWGLLLVLETILIAVVIRARSVRFGIVMHVLANSFGVLITLINVLT